MRGRRLLWALSATFIVYGATIPFHFVGDRGVAADRLRHLTLNPFVSPDTNGRLSIPGTVQNILFFLPFGALGALALGVRSRLLRIVVVTGLGAALSCAIEAAQLFTSDRTASAADVAANTTGAALGAFVAAGSETVLRRIGRTLHSTGLLIPEIRPLLIAFVAIVIAYAQPFDATLDVSTVASKVRAIQSDPWQFTGLRDEGTSLMLSVFLATTLASYLSVLGESRAAVKTAALAIGLVFFLEAAQTLIGSRAPGLWDASVGALGILLGVIIWKASSIVIWPRLWLAVIVAATAIAAALQMLSPFEWTPAYHSVGWFPFLGYYSHTTFETVSHVLELMLLYVPLGFFVGGGQPERRRAMWTAAGLALAVAGPIEYLQGWVVGLYPDVTDVGISLCGACLGAWAGGLGAQVATGRDA